MKCVICKQGDTHPGYATVSLEREGVTLVIKKVPAQVCQNCGEEYLDETTTSYLLTRMEDAVNTGVQVDVRQFVAA
ncbi:MAG: type II toxin-antitoxin system MqsA family antitoxin [Magnetococcales bacterium]|nr:type II toxin-antitoxin system MqsA family antitoxin [Magnetococcales bacterium]MBF0602462.1 type II toxin-antitoxin system MqsA family antitoxin [Magnetococcales bacterium]